MLQYNFNLSTSVANLDKQVHWKQSHAILHRSIDVGCVVYRQPEEKRSWTRTRKTARRFMPVAMLHFLHGHRKERR